jgi:hypothetical protein
MILTKLMKTHVHNTSKLPLIWSRVLVLLMWTMKT